MNLFLIHHEFRHNIEHCTPWSSCGFTIDCQIVRPRALSHRINYWFMCLPAYWQWKLAKKPQNFSSYRKTDDYSHTNLLFKKENPSQVIFRPLRLWEIRIGSWNNQSWGVNLAHVVRPGSFTRILHKTCRQRAWCVTLFAEDLVAMYQKKKFWEGLPWK